jgi:hypothetical protein
VQLSLNVQGVLRDVQQAFYGLRVNAGKQVLAAMMEADRVALCGANNVPDASRKAVRGGTTRSSVVLGGQRIAIAKPRARSLQRGELALPTFAWAAGTDPWTWRHWRRWRPGCPRAATRARWASCPSPTSHRGKYKSLSVHEKRLLKRRQAIEPLIGRTKADHRMDRCWLTGAEGDALHALCCAAGYNIRWLLRAIARLGLGALFCALSVIGVYAAGMLMALRVASRAARADFGGVRARSPAPISLRLGMVG